MALNPNTQMKVEQRAKLSGSLLLFTQAMYKLRTGRDFDLSTPQGREPHQITISRALTKCMRGQTKRLIINIAPRYGKTEQVISFVAWAMAQYPDSNFLYVSYSHSLAKKQTQTIRRIMALPHYKKIFDVGISDDVGAQDNFETDKGGTIYAAGAGGTITGRGAGIMGANRFGGAIIIDDIHKPSEVTSDTIRSSVIDWYSNTLMSRLNSPDTPIIFIGQRLHEDDLAANLLQTGDWETVILKSIDDAGNALNPGMHDRASLLKMQEESPYVYSAQYQQDPQPAGGGIFRPEWFHILEEEPQFLMTFITADTAETDKTYNDATAFSFWGIYKIQHEGYDTDQYAIHWIDCAEIRVEPKDLETEFMAFYANCMRHKTKPLIAAIEKKSTGVTLVSYLKRLQGLRIMEVERTSASGSKITRFLAIQAHIAAGQVSLPDNFRHTGMCLEHCRKITANDSHAHDDIADTLEMAVSLALIQKIIINQAIASPAISKESKARYIMSTFNKVANARSAQYGSRQKI